MISNIALTAQKRQYIKRIRDLKRPFIYIFSGSLSYFILNPQIQILTCHIRIERTETTKLSW